MINYHEILEYINNKDPKGLEALYNSYGKKFYGYAVQKWKLSEDGAWEVVYRTIETLVLKLSNYQFESQAHFNNFLYKVFTNFLRQHFRAHRSKQDNVKYVDLNEEITEDKSVDDLHLEVDKQAFEEYYKSETVENPKLLTLNLALEKLSSDERDILLLRAQNFSYEEIAKFQNIDDKQLKVKHHRAKQKLLKILEETIKTTPHE